MVSLVDDPGLSFNVHEDVYWQLFAREQSLATAGFVVIQAAVARMIKQWADEWTKTLESFDVLETPGKDEASNMAISNLSNANNLMDSTREQMFGHDR
jgi:hypothetical protein